MWVNLFQNEYFQLYHRGFCFEFIFQKMGDSPECNIKHFMGDDLLAKKTFQIPRSKKKGPCTHSSLEHQKINLNLRRLRLRNCGKELISKNVKKHFWGKVYKGG